MKQRPKVRRVSLISVVAICLLSVIISSIILLPRNATAAVSETDLLKKTLLNGLRTCVSDTYMKPEIAPIDYYDVSSLMTSKGFDDGTILVPNGVANTLNDNDVSCKELFTGYDGAGGQISGLLSLYGKSDSNMEDFGYEIDDTTGADSSRLGCVSYEYGYTEGNRQTTGTTNEICLEVGPDNMVVGYSDGIIDRGGADGPIYLQHDPSNYTIAVYSDDVFGGPIAQINTGIGTVSWEKFAKDFTDHGSSITGMFGTSGGEPVDLGYNFRHANTELEGGSAFNMAIRLGTARGDILEYLTGSRTFPQFTLDDKYSLYSTYVDDVEKANSSVYYAEDCSGSLEEAAEETGYAVRSGSEWCGIYGVDSVDGTFNGINSSNNGLIGMSFADIVEELMALDYSQLEDGPGEITDEGISGGLTDDTTNDDTSTTSACFKTAGALGWIMCPVIEAISEATQGVYKNIIEENFLQVESEMIEDDGAYSGWTMFRDFANILFVILFVVVLLSQVTGIGLSNYGIKKTLPRLITVAVLVNISFILCQLAVDISNILGASLNNLFVDLAEQIKGKNDVFDLGGVVGEITNSLLSLTGAGSFVVLGITFGALTWEFWLVPFLLILISVIISLVFFFLLLGVRKAGIIILIALAPLAIVFYALPNTKKIFDRWFKMLSGLLLVYPICGALMGGSKFTSTLILSAVSSGDDPSFILVLVAMLLSAVPFFFIPTILRHSMTAIGNLGTKITNFGNRLGSSAANAAKRSERLQDWNKRLRTNTQYRRAQRAMARAEKGGRQLSSGQARRVSLAKAAFEKQSLEDAANQHYAERSPKQIEAAIAAQELKFQQQQVDEEASRIMTGGVEFQDASGATRAIKANDVEDLTQAYDQAIKSTRDMTRSDKDRAASALQAKALQQLLMGKGDKGRSAMLKTLRRHTFDAKASGDMAQANAVKQFHEHLNENGKYMDEIKSGDVGSYSLINDAASASPGLNNVKAEADYNVMGADKLTPESVAKAGDSYFDNTDQAIRDGSFTTSDERKADLQKLARTMTQALTDSRIQVKNERVATMNNVRKAAYDVELDEYAKAAMQANPSLTRAQAEAQFKAKNGEFQPLKNNEEFRVPRPKAQMPTGWRRATTADTISSGVKEGEWVETGTGGAAPRRLGADEIKRAERIEDHNIQVDIDNSTQP